jgi:hypothetical protein
MGQLMVAAKYHAAALAAIRKPPVLPGATRRGADE